jgi:hypothetical protein
LEQPLSIKGLRLLTISISIVFVLIIGALAYSGYQEVTSIMQSLSQASSQKVFLNANQFSISGLNLENRGVYPLTLALDGEFTLDGTSLGSNSLGPLTISPGSQRRIDFNLTLQTSQALSNSSLARKFLFNGTLAGVQFNFTWAMQPFVTGSVSGGMNETIGAVLDSFDVVASTPRHYNETCDEFPLLVEFTNNSPLSLDAALSAQVISTPLQPSRGNYGSGTMTISAPPGQHYEKPLNMYLVTGVWGLGAYVLELSLTMQGFTYSWELTLQV